MKHISRRAIKQVKMEVEICCGNGMEKIFFKKNAKILAHMKKK